MPVPPGRGRPNGPRPTEPGRDRRPPRAHGAPGAGPEEARATIRVRTDSLRGGPSRPSHREIAMATASVATAAGSRSTEVRSKAREAAPRVLSKPVTEMSSGTDRPRRARATSAPCAHWSL